MSVISCCSSSRSTSSFVFFFRHSNNDYRNYCTKSTTVPQSHPNINYKLSLDPKRLLPFAAALPSASMAALRCAGVAMAVVMVMQMEVVQQERQLRAGAYEEGKGWAAEMGGREGSGATTVAAMTSPPYLGLAAEGEPTLSRSLVKKPSSGGCPHWRRSQWELVLPDVHGRPRAPNRWFWEATSSETGHWKHQRNCFTL